jgi:transcriptional regulator with XRE-family HTH domain
MLRFGVSQIPKSVHSEPYQLLIRLLREAREATGLSQEKLAQKLVKPQSYVSKIELSERQINLVELQEWCDALDISLIDFVKQWQAAMKRS